MGGGANLGKAKLFEVNLGRAHRFELLAMILKCARISTMRMKQKDPGWAAAKELSRPEYKNRLTVFCPASTAPSALRRVMPNFGQPNVVLHAIALGASNGSAITLRFDDTHWIPHMNEEYYAFWQYDGERCSADKEQRATLRNHTPVDKRFSQSSIRQQFGYSYSSSSILLETFLSYRPDW